MTKSITKRRGIIKITSLFKLSAIFWLTTLCISNAQALDKKNNNTYLLDFSEVPLVEILNEVGHITEKQMFYSESDMRPYTNVTVKCNASSEQELMKNVLESTALNFELKDERILVFKELTENNTPVVKMQQDKKHALSGLVLDVNNEPIPGVNIIEAGTTNGTISDIKGQFSLVTSSKTAVINFSFLGFKTKSLNINGQDRIEVCLFEDISDLNELIVVAYGVQKKSDLTGAVSSVKSDDLQKVAVSTPAESLQGRVSGVSVTANSGAPGAGMNVRIRGVASFAGNDPLYIIDGVEGNINYVNPDDIASIEVLKDAASAAIYGSRAANGVVLITTKNGKVGETKMTFSAYAGPQTVSKYLPLMTSSADWLQVNKAAYANAGENPAAWQTDPSLVNTNTDWQDAMFQRGFMQNYNVGFSGGSENLKFLASGNYFDQDGTVIGTGYDKYTARLKLDFTKGRFTFSPNISFTQTNSDDFTSSIYRTVRITPTVPVYDESRENGYGYSSYEGLGENNPVGQQELNEAKTARTDINANVAMSVDITKGLVFKLNAGMRNYFFHERTHNPAYTINPKDNVPFPENYEYRSQFKQSLLEPVLTYHLDIDNHGFDFLAGYTMQSKKFRSVGSTVEGKDASGKTAGFPSQNYNTIDAGIGGTFSGEGTEYIYNRTSVFGRFNYSYNSKYLLQATLRKDGTSKFAEEYRYGIFPSVSAGWNVHHEEFWKGADDIVSRLKVRSSYGILGSDVNLENYFYQGLMESGSAYVFGNNLVGGSYPAGMTISDYRWEQSKDFNLGVDFGILSETIFGTVNYYTRVRSDILVDQPLPNSSGMNSQVMNVGEMKNSGFEFELGYRKSDGNFTYGISGTLSTIKNEVLALGNGVDVQESDLVDWKMAPVRVEVGKSVGAFYLYQTDGLFQNQTEIDASVQPDAQPGDVRYVNTNDDDVIDQNDIAYSGSALPDFEYGFNLDMAYKGFDVNIFFTGVQGNKIFNMQKYYGENMVSNFNYYSSTLDYWTPTNTDTDMPRPVFGDANNTRISDRFLEDGSFLRLKSAQLGYTLPKEILNSWNIDKLRFYISGQNLFTFTKYTGFDPEIGDNTIWNMGIDWGYYPQSRTILLGVQLSL